MVNVNYTREQFEALSESEQFEAVSEVTRDTSHGNVKKIDDVWVINEEVQIGFMTGEFLNPVYSHTLCLEAILRPEQVRAYALLHKVSFQEALETMGKEYVSKYYQYSGIYVEGHTTGIVFLGKDKEAIV